MSGSHDHAEYPEAVLVEKALADVDATIANLSARLSRLTAQVVALEAAAAAPAPEPFAYWFGGKPAAPQTFGRKYGRLDLSEHDPDSAGLEFSLRYLNIAPTFLPGKDVGAIRPRLVRADGDFTAYDDIQIHRDALDDDGITLRTAVYFELGNGDGTHWQLKCIGGLQSAEIGTRYSKKAIIPGRG